MPLPTAVKRKAEQARQAVAATNGASAPRVAPQSQDGEFLSIDSDTSSSTVNGDSANARSDALPTEQVSAQANGEGFRSHALAEDAGSASQMLSDKDTAGDAQARQSGFIDPQDWKARYTALRASRDARSSELEEEVTRLRATNGELENRLAVQEDVPAANRFELDNETRNAIGENQAKAFDQFNDSVEQRFAKQEDEQRAATQKDVERFESDLDSMVPRWRQINVESAWLNWLTQLDDVLQVRRQDMLNGFVRDRDAGSVAALFRSFAVSGGQSQQRNGHSPIPDLSASRAASGMGAEENLVEVWTQSEIADFYKAKNRLYQSGKLVGNKLNEVMAEETRIRTAMEQGRVENR